MKGSGKEITNRGVAALLTVCALLAASCSPGVLEDVKKVVEETAQASLPVVGVFILLAPPADNPVTNNPSVTFQLSGTGSIAGWLVNEAASAPDPNAAAWTVDAPSSFVLPPADGARTLYAWAKNAARQVSASKSLRVTLDTVAPLIASFTRTSASPTNDPLITVALAGASADITAWLLKQEATTPALADSGWTAAKPATFTVSGAAGLKTVSAWARDAAGNISEPKSVSVDLRDPASAPVISEFTLTSATPTNNARITFRLSGAGNISGWKLVEGSATPDPAAAGWTPAAPTFYDFPMVDGSRTLYAWARSPSGELSTPQSIGVVLDFTRPGFSFSRTSPSPMFNVVVDIVLSGDPDISAWFLKENASTPLLTDPGWQGSAPAAYTLPSAGFGTKTVYAWARDAAGNVSDPARSVTVDLWDSTPPSISTFSRSSADPANNPLVSFTLAAGSGGGITHWLVNESQTSPDPVLPNPPGTGWQISLAGYTITNDASHSGDGLHALYAWAKTQYNVVSAKKDPITVTLDTTKPTVAFTRDSPYLTTNTVLQITLSGNDGSGVGINGWLLREGDGTEPLPTAGGWVAKPFTFQVTANAGVKTVYAWARDSAGNVSAENHVGVEIYVVPEVTTFSLISPPAGNPVTNNPAVSFNLAGSSVVTAFLVNESAATPSAADSAWKATGWSPYTLTTMPQGQRTLHAWAKNSSNVVSPSQSITVTLDTVKPTVTFTLDSPALTPNPELQITLTGNDGGGTVIDAWLLREGEGMEPLPTAGGWGAKPSTFTVTSNPGVKTVYAWAKDAAANVSVEKHVGVEIYLVPEVTTFSLLDPPAGNPITKNATILFNLAGSQAVTAYLVNENSSPPAPTNPIPPGTGWQATAPGSYPIAGEGAHTLYAWAKNTSNVVSTSKSIGVTMDTTIPVIDSFTLTSGSPTSSRSITFSLTPSAGSPDISGWLINESAAKPDPGTGSWLGAKPGGYPVVSPGDGSKTVYAWAKDAAGNVGDSKSLVVYVHETPVTSHLEDAVTLVTAHEGIRVHFSEDMDRATLSVTGDFAAGTADWDSTTNPRILTWKPSTIWPSGSRTLTVNGKCAHQMSAQTLSAPISVFQGVCVSSPSNVGKPGVPGAEGGVVHPLDTIQAGIDKAKAAYLDTAYGTSAEVRVAYGTYSMSCAVSPSAVYVVDIKAGVSTNGGYDLGFAARTGGVSTVTDTSTAAALSGSNNPVRAVNADGSSIASSTWFDGFTVNLGKGGAYHCGIACMTAASPTIKNVVIQGTTDTTSTYAWGILLFAGSNAQISYCTIDPGTATTQSAGIVMASTAGTPAISHNTISGGTGAVSTSARTYGVVVRPSWTASITYNSINGGNWPSGSYGYCVYLQSTSSADITDNTFQVFNPSTHYSTWAIYEAANPADPHSVMRNDFAYNGNWYYDDNGVRTVTYQTYSTLVTVNGVSGALFAPAGWNNKSSSLPLNWP